MIGLDTDTLIDLFKGDKKLKEIMGFQNEPISITIINYQEIMFGLDLEKSNHKEEKEYYETLFDNFIIFSLTKESSKKASEIFWNLVHKGENIGKFDSMIAGIFLINGVNKIITKNIKHFEKIPGIEVISY